MPDLHSLYFPSIVRQTEQKSSRRPTRNFLIFGPDCLSVKSLCLCCNTAMTPAHPIGLRRVRQVISHPQPMLREHACELSMSVAAPRSFPCRLLPNSNGPA